jgi:uncharacterized protein (TIGR00290 family)
MKKVLFAWSGGKDSAMALHEIRKNGDCEIVALMTTVTEDYDRVSMHGIRRVLVEQQAESIGLPLEKVLITKDADNGQYEDRMREFLTGYRELGVSGVVFGDIFLEDLKKYREEKLAQVDMEAVFPIWQRDTRETAQSFIDLGFRAVITCVDTEALDRGFSGRDYDESFLADVPESVDPCGENGEFHSFVYDGPVFREPIRWERGEIVLREERFCFCDLLPK